ncbi:MAG: hypothetical protein P8J01_04085 [Acidimicrobiales bacterium]|nr:hypothetical protein [Acidimicrobiales bacterium]
MAAPRYVPSPKNQRNYYESSKRKITDQWRLERPAEQKSASSKNSRFGYQGPDQGYALKIVQYFHERVYLTSDERWTDAAQTAVVVGLKRASLFGRAPTRFDLEAAFCLWGFFDPTPDVELVELRIDNLTNIGTSHNYLQRRVVADCIPVDGLKQGLEKILESYTNDWHSLIDVSILGKPEVP